MLDVVLAPARPLEHGTDVAGPGLARPGRVGRERPRAGSVGSARGRRSSPRSDGMPRVGRSSTRYVATASSPGSAASRGPGRAGSESSSRRTASARSSPTVGRRTCSRPTDLKATGSRGRTPSTCRCTRCSASRSGWPAVGRSSSHARRVRWSASIWRRSDRCWQGAARGAGAHRGDRAGPPVRDGRRGGGVSWAATRSTGCSSSRRWRSSSAGAKGATVLARDGDARLRFEVATEHLTATDTTGAGDAFDAGFLVGWFTARAAGRSLAASLQRGRWPAIARRPGS